MSQQPPSQRPKKSAINKKDFLVGREAESSPDPEPEDVFERSDDTLPTGDDDAEVAGGSPETGDGYLLLCRQLSDYAAEVRRTYKDLTDRLNRLELMFGRGIAHQRQLEALIRQQQITSPSATTIIRSNHVAEPLKTAADFRQPKFRLTDETFRKELVSNIFGD
ncbi:unnamed protein product [Dibothriocephalus latus]|uniref:Uncharacterized protein n=1 Tax=Dibothriocephalus latus TaxID=60516 RepID=A0A3P7QVH1_DIBLA|nr:unnamed protein product [Dibothriocephalus latus]